MLLSNYCDVVDWVDNENQINKALDYDAVLRVDH